MLSTPGVEQKIKDHAAKLGWHVVEISQEQMAQLANATFTMACCWHTQSIYVRSDVGNHRHRHFTMLHELGHALIADERYGKPVVVYDTPPASDHDLPAWSEDRKQAYYIEEKEAWVRATQLVKELDLPISEEVQRERREFDLMNYRSYLWPFDAGMPPAP